MKIKEVALHTSAFEPLRKFYADVLGLPVRSTSNDSFIVEAGMSRLIFERAGRDLQPVYHFAFNIPSNKIDEARSWLLKRVALLWLEDYQSDIAEFEGWHARSVYF